MWEKLIIFSPKPEYVFSLSNGRRIKITRTKYDDLLSSFRESDSQSSRFVHSVAENDVLRIILFLNGEKKPQVDDKFPIRQEFPFVLNPHCDLVQLLSGAYKDKVKDATKKHEETEKSLEESQNAFTWDLMDMVFSDRQFVATMTKARKFEDRKKAIEKSIEAHREEGLQKFSGWVEQFTKLAPEIYKLSELVENIRLFQVAVNNAEILSTKMTLPQDKAKLFVELNKLASLDIAQISTESFCLDCYFKYGRTPFRSFASNIRSIDLPDLCPSCQQIGLAHSLIFEYPRGLHKFVMPETNWLQEAIVGCTVANLKHIQKVFVHKMLHYIADGSESKGVEADVILLTDDNRMILIEVTTQTDADNLLRTLTKKRDNLREIGIQYDGYAYVTASPSFREYLTIDEKTRLFGAHHLGNLNNFLQHEFNL